jgi:CubicO group peptidase (beta-lactamase class C family)
MIKWLKVHISGGKYPGGPLIRDDLLNEMHTQQMVMPLVPDMPGYGYTEIERVSYCLGWRVQSYRGHMEVWHTGAINGFTCKTSFLPGQNMGVVVLGNMNHSNLPVTITLNIYDRLFGLDAIPWSKRLKEKEDRMAQEAKAALEKRAAARKPNAPPTHPLDDYVGDYWHPGYETLTITREGDSLKAAHNGVDYALAHYHYDIFETSNKDMEFSVLAPFIVDNAGSISEFRLQIEPLVDAIVFTRKA